MPNMNASPQQIQIAAAAGVELLSNKDLLVPMSLALSGHLGVLQALLGSIANGDLLVIQVPPQDKVVEENPLKSVPGGKKDEDKAG